MIFEITRTSGRFSTTPQQPCEEAFKSRRPRVDSYGCTEEEYDERYSRRSGTWRSRGTNHRVLENGGIARDMEVREVWCVELGSLEDLMALMRKCNEHIIVSDDSLEIYDDYRE